ncbi:MAG: DUF2007 domain-containing protein [Rikenellaceae bacterium]
MKDANIIVLERFNEVSRAEIIKALLESNGIECSLAHETIQTVLPYISSGVAPVELLVREEDAERAREILTSAVDTEDFKAQTGKKK